jgi:hypothetical protein
MPLCEVKEKSMKDECLAAKPKLYLRIESDRGKFLESLLESSGAKTTD